MSIQSSHTQDVEEECAVRLRLKRGDLTLVVYESAAQRIISNLIAGGYITEKPGEQAQETPRGVSRRQRHLGGL